MSDRLNDRAVGDESPHGPSVGGPAIGGTAVGDHPAVLTAETREKIAAEVRRFPQRRTALLPALKHAQAQVGWLPPAVVSLVAELVGVSHASANELASFYSMLRLRPGGRTRVEVCVQLPCALAGGEKLLQVLAEGLGIAPGEVTPDGRVELLRTSECFGACHRAPMCRVGDEYRENLTPEAARRLLDELGAGTLVDEPGSSNCQESAASPRGAG